MKKVTIIGAAGYVGLHLVQMLDNAGYQVLAVTRGNGPLLIKGKQVQVKQAAELAATDKSDLVVNLAFARSPQPDLNTRQNREIVETIAKVSHPGSRIVHVSTLAVFGYRLDRPQELKPVELCKDYMYVRSKIEMENLLLKNFVSNELHIVRAGNVMGPASGWTCTLADALFYGLPVLHPQAAYSNSTDVNNLCDYIRFLLQNTCNTRFHHLAELAEMSWQQWLHEMAGELGVVPKSLNNVPFYPNTATEELQNIFDLNPAVFLRRASRSRFWQQAAQSVIEMVPAALKKATRPATAPVFETDTLTQWLLSCPTLFRHQIDNNWKAPVSKEQSIASVKTWLHRAGYIS